VTVLANMALRASPIGKIGHQRIVLEYHFLVLQYFIFGHQFQVM
jgi:hypothetical protein